MATAAEVDHLPYIVVEGEEDLVCCGAPCAKLGLLVTKLFASSSQPELVGAI